MPWNDDSKPEPWQSKPSGEAEVGRGGRFSRRRSLAAAREADGEGAAPGPWGEIDRRSPPIRPEFRDSLKAERPRRPAGDGERADPPPQHGPHLDELAAHLRGAFGGLLRRPGRKGLRPQVFVFVAAAAFAAWALTGVYVVHPDQIAVVSRLGFPVRRAEPGVHYRLPPPIETIQKLPVGGLNQIDFGGDGVPEGLLPTGDGQLVDLAYTVEWRVTDVSAYLAHLADPQVAVKLAAESAMAEVVGRTPIAALMTDGRAGAERDAARLMQAALESYGAGVQVAKVEIRSADPPPKALPALRDAAAAREQAEAAAAQANADRGRATADAKADAARTVQTAETYRDQTIATAKAEAARFDEADQAYRRAPEITREQLYLETMQRVLAHARTVVLAPPKGRGGAVELPSDLFRSARTPGGPAAAGAPRSAPRLQASRR